MPVWVIDIIKFVVGGLVGSLITFQKMKWKVKQDRKTDWAKRREPIYAQGLEFVYDVEKNQADAQELERILKRWMKWFPLNTIYLPPVVNDALYGAMHWTLPIAVDLHNKNVDRETVKIFRENLQNAKKALMESKDIGWLPEDLK